MHKSQKNENQSAVNSVNRKHGSNDSTFQFVDNRPEAVAQKRIQRMINSNKQYSASPVNTKVADNNSTIQRAIQFEDKLMTSMQEVALDDETWTFYINLDSETKELFRDFVSDSTHTVQYTTFLSWMDTQSKKTVSEVVERMRIELARWYNGTDDVARDRRFDTGFNGVGNRNAEVSPETLDKLKQLWNKNNFRIPLNTTMRNAWSQSNGARTGDRMHDFLVENTHPHKALFNFHIEVKR
ncbi:hypothetical protein [Shewanella waksmanii]|uniref:hypothetical protein n=1 Tax=Shewanella waksmanii TaxID=213783 RepID=UPI0012FB1458|nr:hypothetical protein [Shewanella waksmanii]